MRQYYLGFDIGGTKCAAILGRIQHTEILLVGRQEFPSAQTVTPEATVEKLICSAEALMQQAQISKAELCAAGVSCGGPLDSSTGRILSPPNLPGWDDVPITKWLGQHFGVPVGLQNDANACALAEWRFGAAKGKQNVIFITYGTGCGAGLIFNGRLYEGSSGMAGECGHIRLSDYGPVGYGKWGSAEGFCSGGGMTQIAQQLALEYKQMGIQTGLTGYDVRTLADAARRGNPLALQVFGIAGEKLGAMLSLMIDLLNPDTIVIGSIYTRCRDLLEEKAAAVIRRETLHQSRMCCEILPAALGDRIGDFAALSVAVEAAEK